MGPFDTPLTPDQEARYRQWKLRVAPQDSGDDYDFRGAFLAGLHPAGPEAGADQGHWPDTYKKPNHPTFSDQSIYSSLTGTQPGTWGGPNQDQYVPFRGDRVKRRMFTGQP